jgi:hypothetical protein
MAAGNRQRTVRNKLQNNMPYYRQLDSTVVTLRSRCRLQTNCRSSSLHPPFRAADRIGDHCPLGALQHTTFEKTDFPKLMRITPRCNVFERERFPRLFQSPAPGYVVINRCGLLQVRMKWDSARPAISTCSLLLTVSRAETLPSKFYDTTRLMHSVCDALSCACCKCRSVLIRN